MIFGDGIWPQQCCVTKLLMRDLAERELLMIVQRDRWPSRIPGLEFFLNLSYR
jgi:hypothetical protein